jgi:hypothetical protein
MDLQNETAFRESISQKTQIPIEYFDFEIIPTANASKFVKLKPHGVRRSFREGLKSCDLSAYGSIFTIFLYYGDIITDVICSVYFFNEGSALFGGLILGFIFLGLLARMIYGNFRTPLKNIFIIDILFEEHHRWTWKE